MNSMIIGTGQIVIALSILTIIARFPDRHSPEALFFAKHRWTLNDSYKVLVPLILVLWLTLLPSKLDSFGFLTPFLISSSIWYLGIYGLFHFVVKRRYGLSIADFGIDRANFLRSGIVTANILGILTVILFSVAQRPVVFRHDTVEWLRSHAVMTSVIMFTTVFVSPVFEQLLFKGILYAPVARKMGAWWAIALLSLVEASLNLGHHHTYDVLIVFFPCAFLAYCLYRSTKSLYFPIMWNVWLRFGYSRSALSVVLAGLVDSHTIDLCYIYGTLAVLVPIDSFWLSTLLEERWESQMRRHSNVEEKP